MSHENRDNPPAIERIGELATRVRAIQGVQQLSGSFLLAPPSVSTDTFIVELAEPSVMCVDTDANRLSVGIHYKFEASPIDPNDDPESSERSEPNVFVEAQFVVHYDFERPADLTDEERSVFGRINGNLNVYPYWREFLSSCLGRAGLPAFMLPPFNAAAKIDEIKAEQRHPADEAGGD